MIERIVLIKLHDEHASPGARAEVAAHTRAVLPTVPGLGAVSVSTPADEKSAGSWDLSIVAHFDKLDDIAPYLAHPIHREYVDDFLRPKMACIKAWNFER
jgi:hypothetical protein